jgi:alpha-glucoside transport system permease protein
MTDPVDTPAAARRRRGALHIPVRVRVGFLAPAVLVLLAIIGWPILFSMWLSLHNADGSQWVGLHNYVSIFTDPATLTALKNNLIWLATAPTLACALGLIFAVLSERIRWATAFKVVIFMPMAISFLAAGVIFELVYQADPSIGVANAVMVEVHDTFAPSSQYPAAQPRSTLGYRQSSNGYTSPTAYAPGSVATVPLTGFSVLDLPKSAVQAAPATAVPGEITGTVWLDLVYGGGGTPGHLDPGKKGTPGITVEALAGTRVVARATAGPDGTFALHGLSPGTRYRLELPASDFAQPYAGVSWLGPDLVTPAIIVAYLWIWAGFAMVLIAAGLSGIPRELQEAAKVDGASDFQIFRKITVPLLAPVLLVVLVTLAINVLKIFDLVYIISPGSTLSVANVLAVQMWSVSFGGAQNQGLGSAIGVFLYLLVLPAMYVNIRRIRRERRES